MSIERAHDDSRIEAETPEFYCPAMPSETLVEWGRQLVEVPRWYE